MTTEKAPRAANTASAPRYDINVSNTGLALRGYDPVAYFTKNQAILGDHNISVKHDKATYWFSSETHKFAFQADPKAYLPQYGGFCAFGVSKGFKFDGNPELWKVVDGALFLNLAADIHDRWEEDISGFIQRADANWKTIAQSEPTTLLKR